MIYRHWKHKYPLKCSFEFYHPYCIGCFYLGKLSTQLVPDLGQTRSLGGGRRTTALPPSDKKTQRMGQLKRESTNFILILDKKNAYSLDISFDEFKEGRPS